MFDFHYITKEDLKNHYPNWPEISDHPYRKLVVGDSGYRKTNALLVLVNYELDIDKSCSYSKCLNSTPYFARKISDKRVLQQT